MSTQHFFIRDYPEPVYPPESHEKLSKNYYFTRDARNEIHHPIAVGGQEAVSKQLADGTAKPADDGKKERQGPPIPGKPSNWDSHSFWTKV